MYEDRGATSLLRRLSISADTAAVGGQSAPAVVSDKQQSADTKLLLWGGRVPVVTYLFMVALCNRADHHIFILWFLLLSSSSSFFPRLISAVGDWMSTILPHMVWP